VNATKNEVRPTPALLPTGGPDAPSAAPVAVMPLDANEEVWAA
jgi:hypothetical protein